MSILIVDDERNTRRMIQAFLNAAGHTDILEAASAREAFQYLGIAEQESQPNTDIDLILMDLLMPELSGVEACRIIRSHPAYADIPLIVVTASEDMEKLEASYDAGASDYIRKPIHRIELIARVNAALRLKKEMDTRKQHAQELLRIQKELREANKKLHQLTLKDGLTGIANRRALDDCIKREWLRAVREKTFLSVILLDIDHFKLYNDTYGHQAGDRCLQQIATALTKTVRRPADLVARYGGEEFALVLPNTGRDGAAHVARMLQEAILELKMPHEMSPVSKVVTASFGVATMQPSLKSKHNRLIELADRMLYQAKRAGRNRIQIADGFGDEKA